MRKVIILFMLNVFLCAPLFAQSGVAYDGDKLKEEVKERIKRAKEKGSRFNMVGSVTANRLDYLLVNGEIFRKLRSTTVIGKVGVGSKVKVKGYLQNGEKVLTHIIVNKKINNASKLKDDEKINFDGEEVGVLPDDPSIKFDS